MTLFQPSRSFQIQQAQLIKLSAISGTILKRKNNIFSRAIIFMSRNPRKAGANLWKGRYSGKKMKRLAWTRQRS